MLLFFYSGLKSSYGKLKSSSALVGLKSNNNNINRNSSNNSSSNSNNRNNSNNSSKISRIENPRPEKFSSTTEFFSRAVKNVDRRL